MKLLQIDRDAFSNGQIDSKLWLCQELENLFTRLDKIWIYGGWYGLTGFLLKSRNRIQIKNIKSYDIDPHCQEIADMINENWVFKEWQFKSFTEDCNLLTPEIDSPDLIINTSTEHFEQSLWWDNIPKEFLVALQGNDLDHDDHTANVNNLNEFLNKFPVENVLYKGKLKFSYPNMQFTRFMIIGYK